MFERTYINRNIFSYGILFTVISFIEWRVGDLLNSKIKSLDYTLTMKTYEWLIVLTVVLVFVSWKNITGKYFTPYTIFYFFLAIFNAGQFIMWAFNIHYITHDSKELGVATHIRYMDIETLLKIIIITLPAITAFHAGALILLGFEHKKKSIQRDFLENEKYCAALRRVGIFFFIISYAISMNETVKNFGIAKESGYTSLYYGETTGGNPILKYLGYMFLPSIFAVFIGFKCSRKSFFVLSLAFLPYMLLNVIMGDRGSWVYFICLWIWCYWIFFYKKAISDIQKKKIQRKKIIILILSGAIFLSFVSVFVKFRDIGFDRITIEDMNEVFSDLRFVFVKPFFEMGQSARVLGIIIQDNIHKSWTGGNTYISGIISMPLPRIKMIFGFYEGYLENWISQTHMHLKNYGIGFTAVAEAYLNGGEIFYPFYMFVMGAFVGKLGFINVKDYANSEKMFICLASMVSLMTICRGSVELSLRKWFFGCIALWLICRFIAGTFKLKVKG